ncbi:MAG: hypothetical protein H6608_10010 [Flavobacteriales bacterium]|nr:hypothetical protein [Bacteroidota bacterium]MCB9241457.1 hypothetical protein [Flavobacteriales bacterium]
MRALAVILLFFFTSSATELHQVIKLPVLIHHYLEHKHEHPHQDLANFLSDHYLNGSQHSDTHHEHNQLPFKSDHCSPVHIPVLLDGGSTELTAPLVASGEWLHSMSESMFSAQVLNTIWQPPKMS